MRQAYAMSWRASFVLMTDSGFELSSVVMTHAMLRVKERCDCGKGSLERGGLTDDFL